MSELYVKLSDVEQMLENINPVDYGSMFSYEAHNAVSDVLNDIRRDMLPSLTTRSFEERVAKWQSHYDRKKDESSVSCTSCHNVIAFKGNKMTTDGECYEGKTDFCPECGCKMVGSIPWDEHAALVDELKELLDDLGRGEYAQFLETSVRDRTDAEINSLFSEATSSMSIAELEYEIRNYKQ